ncbi:Uncharacterised protein [Candidatus Gugararchaeum adminiculabundum]|nr:Uncharacterised protein [Candidatus Gugararchaeum adminiculabundum]
MIGEDTKLRCGIEIGLICMALKIKEKLEQANIILVLVPSVDYGKTVVDISKELSDKSLCYVSLNKTFGSLKENFDKAKMRMDSVIVIDAISKTIRNTPNQTAGCYFVSSPAAFTEISILVSKILRHKFEYVIFDSLTNLLVYSDKGQIVRFVSNIVNQARENKAKVVLFALDIDEQQALIKECTMAVDEVIKL